jgi:hypothetical protein
LGPPIHSEEASLLPASHALKGAGWGRHQKCFCFGVINQSIIVWTPKTKSLLSSFYKREEFPLFGKEGLGEIFATICLFNYRLLSTSHAAHDIPPSISKYLDGSILF